MRCVCVCVTFSKSDPHTFGWNCSPLSSGLIWFPVVWLSFSLVWCYLVLSVGLGHALPSQERPVCSNGFWFGLFFYCRLVLSAIYRFSRAPFEQHLYYHMSIFILSCLTASPQIESPAIAKQNEGEENATIECVGYAQPAPRVTWKLHGEAVTSTPSHGGAFQKTYNTTGSSPWNVTSRLHLGASVATTQLGGNYTCEVSSAVGPAFTVTRTTEVMCEFLFLDRCTVPRHPKKDVARLDFTSVGSSAGWFPAKQFGFDDFFFSVLPNFVVEPRSEIVLQGMNVSFHWNVTGFPTPTVRWTFGGAELPDKNPATSGSLTLSAVRATGEYEGNYTCSASNKAGSVSRTVTLTVQGRRVSPSSFLPFFRNACRRESYLFCSLYWESKYAEISQIWVA